MPYTERCCTNLDSGKNSLVTAASIQMRAEIFSYENNDLVGVLHSYYLVKPFEFTSLVQMIEKMESIFDTIGFPEAFMTPRMFGVSKRGRNKDEQDGNDIMNEALNFGSQTELGGAKCTFEINVRFRQNATWQGQILWVEKNMKQNFRSVLEMLKLMDEALTENEVSQTAIKWDNNE